MHWLTDNWHSLFPYPWGSISLSILALACGGWVGIERERKEKPAGMRTMACSAIGDATFTMVGYAFPSSTGESGRVAAQIVTGIGFLGGGVLLRANTGIRGVTTAATIWLVAAMGMAIGAGHAGAGVGLPLLTRRLLSLVNWWESSKLAGASPFTIRQTLHPETGKTERMLENLFEQFH